MDFESACRHFLEDVLLLEPGERCLVYAEANVASAAGRLQREATAHGFPTDLIQLHEPVDLPRWVAQLEAALVPGRYRVVCEMTERYLYQTSAWGSAIRAGARVYGLGAMDEVAFIRCIGEVNHEGLHRFGLALQCIMEAARRVQIQAPGGTDLIMRMNGHGRPARLVTRLLRREPSRVWPPSGWLRTDPSATFVGGQLAFRGRPSSISGTVVVDGYLSPPLEVGPLEDPVVLTVHQGRVTDIAGCPISAPLLEGWLQGDEKQVKHFCIGFNPGAQLNGTLMEAERAFGHLTIGIGQFPQHTDGVIRGARLVVDGETVMEHNQFSHPDLRAPAQALHR